MTHMRFRPLDAGSLLESGSAMDVPVRLDRLTDGEQVLIRAFRRWVQPTRPGDGDAAWNAVAVHFGGRSGKPIMAALILLVERMRASARRPIRHHMACCPCLSADEVRLLNLVAMAGTGRLDRARPLAADLIGLDVGSARGGHQTESFDLAEAAHRLAQALADAGTTPSDRRLVRAEGASDGRGADHAAGMPH